MVLLLKKNMLVICYPEDIFKMQVIHNYIHWIPSSLKSLLKNRQPKLSLLNKNKNLKKVKKLRNRTQ